ncbi:DUF6906 family protein [Paenibacillus polymyxa]|uniref:DUF6906 family protein n=1 Tax=Paenibacillus polymyxa TaxID=1406 RepID=UPI003AF5256D
MKNGKRPNRRQQAAILEAGFVPSDWLVYKAGPYSLHIVSRKNEETHIISLERAGRK